MSVPVVADGVVVYATDPTPTAGELVFDFVAGQTRLVLAGVQSATCVLTPNSVLAETTDPGTVGSELAFDFTAGAVQLVVAHDQSEFTTVNAGVAASTGTAHGAQVSVGATVGVATAVGVAETPGVGFTPVTATATGAGAGAQTSVGVDAGALSTGTANAPQRDLLVNADAASGAAVEVFQSILTETPDPNARTVTIRDHGHTTTVKLRRR